MIAAAVFTVVLASGPGGWAEPGYLQALRRDIDRVLDDLTSAIAITPASLGPVGAPAAEDAPLSRRQRDDFARIRAALADVEACAPQVLDEHYAHLRA